MASSSNKKLNCQVILLDDGAEVHQLSRKASASELYALVFSNLNLLETDYFGLEYMCTKKGVTEWLDKEKTILSQVSLPSGEKQITFKLKVKFYTADPSLLEHHLTKYFFALQIKQDLLSGRLICNENTAAILSSYIVQSELGDFQYLPNDHDYLKSIKLVPNQTDEIEDRIAECHKTLRGMSVVEAEFQLLKVVTKTDMYGVVTHQCQDSDGFSLHLAVTHSGIHTFIKDIRSTSYIWIKIRKLGFKRKRFVIKLFPSGTKSKGNNVAEFTFPSRDAAKAFWKLAVEHHAFFKKLEVKPTRRHKHPLLRRGSSFRYNGRTQTQLVEQMKQKWGHSTFDRSMSLRNFRSSSQHIGKAATFQNRQELGIMTLDRAPHARMQSQLHVPSESQVTLTSRYSGCYNMDAETKEKPPLTVSQSLSTITPLVKSSSKFDLKPAGPFLPKDSGERNTNRDSIAVVEDNRVELERLVEQINSDLTTAQQEKALQEENARKRNVSTSSIERFLKSTAQPIIPPKTQPVASEPLSPPATEPTPQMTATYTVSDDETLEILLTENIKDAPVTDLDSDAVKNGHQKQENGQQFTVTADVNDILDQAGQRVDNSLELKLDEISDSPNGQVPVPDPPKHLSSGKDSGDEDTVFRSSVEISLPPHARRGRSRSKQETLEDLEGVSKLAERVLRSNEENLVHQRSQELSDLATQVLEFCGESDTQSAQLSDLSDLLAHYDTINQQQQAFQRHRPEPITTDSPDQLPASKPTRQPLIRPALPPLAVSKEKRNAEQPTFIRLADSSRVDRKGLTDSGIDDGLPSREVNGAQSTSDGYSSTSDDSLDTIASPSKATNSTLAVS